MSFDPKVVVACDFNQLSDLHNFVDKVLVLQKDPKKYLKLVKSSHNSVKKYDLDKNVLKIENMYKKFVNLKN